MSALEARKTTALSAMDSGALLRSPKLTGDSGEKDPVFLIGRGLRDFGQAIRQFDERFIGFAAAWRERRAEFDKHWGAQEHQVFSGQSDVAELHGGTLYYVDARGTVWRKVS